MSDTPKFHLARVREDGTLGPPEIVRVGAVPLSTVTDRRGFLSASRFVALSAGAASLAGCGDGCGERDDDYLVRSGGGYTTRSRYVSTGPVDAIAMPHDGHLLASAGGAENFFSDFDSGLKLWTLPEGRLAAKVGDGVLYGSVAFAPDGAIVASATEGQHRGDKVDIWDVATQTMRGTLTDPSWTIPVRSLVYSADGNYLAAIVAEDAIVVWSMPEGREVLRLTAHPAIAAIAFDPASGALAACAKSSRTTRTISKNPNAIVLWEVPSGRPLATFESYANFSALTFEPNGRHLAVGSRAGHIQIWDMPLRNGASPALSIPSSGGSVAHMGFLPDGRLMAAHSDSMKVWSFAAGEPASTSIYYNGYQFEWSINTGLLAAADSSEIRLFRLEDLQFITALFDRSENPRDVGYRQFVSDGILHTEVVEGPKQNDGGCTCNCVVGIVKRTLVRPSEGGGGRRCVCIPVCQAHRLDHADPFVRAMAQALTPRVAARDPDYLEWAEYTATPRAAALIRELRSHPHRFNSAVPVNVERCLAYLWHEDLVVRVMAAQMLSTHPQNLDSRNQEDQRRVKAALRLATDVHWRRRTAAPRLTRTLN